MNTLDEQYKRVSLERVEINNKIKLLERSKIVKRYVELLKKREELANRQEKLYTEVEKKKYLDCNHIWLTVLKEFDSCDNVEISYCGCIKCGLDGKILRLMEHGFDYELLLPEQQIMYDVMANYDFYDGTFSDVTCDLKLAQAIYKRIKEVYPDLTDEKAKKYFEIALDNIRNIEVSDERKKSRAKRLSLSPNFNNWK